MPKIKKKQVDSIGFKNPAPRFQDVKKWYDRNLHPGEIDVSDQGVYENIYHAGRFAGIFQCTQKGAQLFFQKLKPKSLTEIATATSIYRPGPLAADVDKVYKESKEHPERVTYDHPLIRQVLEPTFGSIIFQEQIMQLGHVVGGLNLDECDKLRKAITKRSMSGKSKAKEEAERLEKEFIKGAVERGVKKEIAEELFDKMEYFSGYGFNKSLSSQEELDTYDAQGNFQATKQLKDVRAGDYLRSRDESTKSDVFVRVNELHDHGVIQVHEFELDDGRRVTCTMDHKFRTLCGRMLPMHQIIREDLEIVVDDIKM